MNPNHFPIDKTSPEYYKPLKPGRPLKLALLGAIFFIIAFLINFPIQQRVKNLIESNIIANLDCPISYSDISFQYIFPKIKMENLIIPNYCLGNTRPGGEHFGDLSVNLAFPSIIPFGPRVSIPFNKGDSSLKILATATFSGLHLNIRDSVIDRDLIALLIPEASPIQGEFNLNSIFTIPYNQSFPSHGKIKIDSSNLYIPAQNIQGFDVPLLNFNDLIISATIDPQTVTIHEALIGNDTSIIRALFSGNIDINHAHFNQSELNINGQVHLSESFLRDFSFVQLFLQNARQDDGSYAINISGTLASPRPNF